MKRQKAKGKRQKPVLSVIEGAKVRFPVFLCVLWSFLTALSSALLFPSVLWARENTSSLSLEENSPFIFHPIVVHFAIALVLFGFVVDCFSSLRGQAQMQEAGRICFLSGVVALGLAVVTGWVEQELPRPASMFDEQM